jgi:nitrogen fixation NifU-like protein
MDNQSSSLYKQHILDHYKNPRNIGRLNNPSNQSEAVNKSCGDEVYLDLKIVDGVVEDVGYSVSGCAICVASISMLSEKIKGRKIDELGEIEDVEILEMFGMTEKSGRVKCALISKDALLRAIDV